MKARRLAFSADRTPPTAAARRASTLVAISDAAERAPGIVTTIAPMKSAVSARSCCRVRTNAMRKTSSDR